VKPETVERLAYLAARAWELSKLREYFAILDRHRARVNRAIASGSISADDAQAAWKRGYDRGVWTQPSVEGGAA
jgi:hypothetical protein